jgi:amino acid transporter
MTYGPSGLRQSWSPLDFGLHSFLVVNPFALGLWIFSFAPLVGGNLFVAALLGAGVMLLGAIVFGALVETRPWTGGDYSWQTRLLDRRIGAVLTLASWWLAVALLAPVYGNLFLVEVIDPLLATLDWDDLASWFQGGDGAFVASLIAISVATAFVGLGMRRAAIAQRMLVAVGVVALVAFLGLLLTHSPNEFSRAFNEQSAQTYGTGRIASTQILETGTFDARVGELEPGRSLGLVPLVLLFALWIGWAGPLAGEVRGWKPQLGRAVLIRTVVVWTMTCLLFFIAIGRGMTWDLWNEANNLYWGTIYGTTAPTPLPGWPNPVLFAAWLMDSTALRVLLVCGMAAWVVGFAATLFLAATRALVAAGCDRVLPGWVARTYGDGVPVAALAVLVVPACGLAALAAYWDAFSSWTAAAVVALALTSVGSAIATARAFRRESLRLAVVALLFGILVAVVAGAWIADPLYGVRTVGSLGLFVALYALATATLLSTRARGLDAALGDALPEGEGGSVAR